MSGFIPSNYEIVHGGEAAINGPFCSSPEILGYIARRLPPGVYHVYRIEPPAWRDRPAKTFWAEVTNHGGQCVTYRPDPPQL